MKPVTLTPRSSPKSTTTCNNTDHDQSEIRDTSSYFPGCRKDANCSCDMCLASINATRDLIPLSTRRASLTRRSKPISRSPISFSPSDLSTPQSRISPVIMESPPLKSTARMSVPEKKMKKNRGFGFGGTLMRLILVVGLIFGVEFGFSLVVSRVLQPELSPDIVRNLGEESWFLQDLEERIVYLKKELQGLVGANNLNGTSLDCTWKIIQDGLLLNSRCTLYKTAVEEVSIWGWPLQTAGLLTTTFSSQSFTILSGRVTEWTNGTTRYLIRKANRTWTQGKWSASVVHFDANTWILEYKRSPVIENTRLVSAVLEFFRFRITRQLQKMYQEFWLWSTVGNQFRESAKGFKIPT